jgi:hypothetical protein
MRGYRGSRATLPKFMHKWPSWILFFLPLSGYLAVYFIGCVMFDWLFH